MIHPPNTREGFLKTLARLKRGQTLHIQMLDDSCVSIGFGHIRSTGTTHIHGSDLCGQQVGIIIAEIKQSMIIESHMGAH